MKQHARWIAACAVLWLSACCTVPHPKVNTEARRAAAVNNRWIGMTRPLHRSCPVPATAHWTVRPLVPLGHLSQDLKASVHKAGLDRFCVYDYHGQKRHPELPQEVAQRLRPGAEPDRIAMATSADSLETIVQDPFYQRFRHQVRMPTPINLDAGVQPSVRLAFLDSQPTGDGVARHPDPGKPDHGYALTNIAGQLVHGAQGDGPSFSVQIGSRLALPVVSFDPVTGTELIRDVDSGGFRGTYADLTKAIVDEINGWQQQKASSGGPQHLVLNLSVGWDGEKFGGWETQVTDMPSEVQAVYGALQVAAAQGVLVVAAAGNELSGLNPTGQPLLPGGWETRGLVYAVSGVDAKDHPLVNTRSLGEAPRVAYADHVTVPDVNVPEVHTPTMTGTSVATAVVSTTAALVWSYRPNLAPADVMQLLSVSADELPRTPNFAADLAPGNVRRISLCNALCRAHDPSGQSCPAPECGPMNFALLSPDLSQFSPGDWMDTTMVTPVNVAGWNQHPNLLDQPWIGTQPGVDPCPNCVAGPPDRTSSPMLISAMRPMEGVARASFRSSADQKSGGSEATYKLRIDIPQEWAAGTLSDATLELFDFLPNGRKRFLTGFSLNGPFSQGQTLEVTNPLAADIDADVQARLRFTLYPPDGSPLGTQPLTVDSPLFIEH